MKDTFPDASFLGSLLVASSLVDDPIYSGGVCLIVHQDDEQVYGVMLNRPLKPDPTAMLAMIGKSKSSRLRDSDFRADPDPEAADVDESNPPAVAAGEMTKLPTENMLALPNLGMIHFGGPLSGPVVALHQSSEFAEAEPGSGIYLAAQKQHLESLLAQHPNDCRLIVGHLRWDLAQLETEVDAGVWHLAPATAEAVFAAPDEIWPRLIRRATSRSLARWMGTPDVIAASELN